MEVEDEVEVEVEVDAAVAVAVAVRVNDCTMQMRNEETNFTTCLTAVCLSVRPSAHPSACQSSCLFICLARSSLPHVVARYPCPARPCPALLRPGWLSKFGVSDCVSVWAECIITCAVSNANKTFAPAIKPCDDFALPSLLARTEQRRRFLTLKCAGKMALKSGAFQFTPRTVLMFFLSLSHSLFLFFLQHTTLSSLSANSLIR